MIQFVEFEILPLTQKANEGFHAIEDSAIEIRLLKFWPHADDQFADAAFGEIFLRRAAELGEEFCLIFSNNQQHAFDDDLLDQLPLAGTQGSFYGNFPAQSETPRQQKTGDVQTRNQ